jgi:cysteine desulfurase
MIYVDYNASSPLSPGAREAMTRAFECWGNPTSLHRPGREAAQLLEKARAEVAARLGVTEAEVVFTSGGSEANTMAVLGSYLAIGSGFRFLTSKVEHSSIRETTKLLEKLGADVTFVRVFPTGALDLDHLEAQLREKKPHLVSLMAANNETGVRFPMESIARLCKEHGVFFHTDAVQAFGKGEGLPWADAAFVSVSAHKVYGPKGCGALVVRKGRALIPIHYGGSQEIKRRGGTHNLIGICGFGGACAELSYSLELGTLRDHFESRLIQALEGLSIQGHGAERLTNTSNVRFQGISSEVMLSALDLDGIYVSAGSACSSGSLLPSAVLIAMGLTPDEARECVRFSWGRHSTLAEVDTVAEAVINHVQRIRTRRGKEPAQGV